MVLQALNRRPETSLHDLHRETGLPKPSILRLLRTLEAMGLATPASGYGHYQLLGRVKSLSCGFHHEPLIIEAAEQLLTDFTKSEGWPVMLGFFDVDAMVVRICTIPHTSLWVEESLLDRRLSMAGHALGRAYLAFSAPRERMFLLEILRQSADPQDLVAQDGAAMAHMLDQICTRGYATSDAQAAQRASTIAVPVRDRGRIVACLGLTWIDAAMSQARAVEQCLPRLLTLSETISQELGHAPLR